jgi:hypothetical protein
VVGCAEELAPDGQGDFLRDVYVGIGRYVEEIQVGEVGIWVYLD